MLEHIVLAAGNGAEIIEHGVQFSGMMRKFQRTVRNISVELRT